MPSSSRTFIALPIPTVQRTRLGRLQGLIAPEIPNAHWVEPSLFHLTLAFLGDVPDVDLARLCKAVSEASSEFDPITLNLQSLGAFPNPERPRVVWVGIPGPDLDALTNLQEAVAGAAAEAGYPPDDDRFHPHVTLGRIKSKRGQEIEISRLIPHYRSWAAGLFTSSEVVVYASTLTPEGPSYMPLARAPLRGEKRKSEA
ncbi:RNA 2',3'-cyclic phosphodiesterase [Tundrisphaera lichenicola]|uniref:RNA 2',3'-cyclic phosphodiesterase n=1 Tax=Tundrisphaera lichenicola TaxID=2029860 RepID=UPI003EB6CD6C